MSVTRKPRIARRIAALVPGRTRADNDDFGFRISDFGLHCRNYLIIFRARLYFLLLLIRVIRVIRKLNFMKIIPIAVPTPFYIGDVNVYLIKEDPLTLVDTGPKTPEAISALREGLRKNGVRAFRHPAHRSDARA